MDEPQRGVGATGNESLGFGPPEISKTNNSLGTAKEELAPALRERMLARLESRPQDVARPVETWTARLFWLLCLAAFVLGLWQIGPLIAERYQYAMTRGRVKAEFENAQKLLGDATLPGLSQSSVLVAQKIRPSVVSIMCTKLVEQGFSGRRMRADGQGSGVIISDSGYVMTNAHVVAGAEKILVTTYDRKEYNAQVVGTDVRTDLAVLKISGDELIPANWGDSDQLGVGSMVWAIGSPYGLDQSVTSGIISGRDRYEPERGEGFPQQELLQTDAAVNPGNSGGPLVNASGDVIGINTSIVGDAFQGISFAVPSAVARFVGDQLIKYGFVSRGYLGLIPDPVPYQALVELGLPDLDGALVTNLVRNSPAQQAGIVNGDVIRSWNGQPVKNYLLLYRWIAMTPPNSVAEVELFRGGQLQKISVKVIEGPQF